jgi:hypothetical protein
MAEVDILEVGHRGAERSQGRRYRSTFVLFVNAAISVSICKAEKIVGIFIASQIKKLKKIIQRKYASMIFSLHCFIVP